MAHEKLNPAQLESDATALAQKAIEASEPAEVPCLCTPNDVDKVTVGTSVDTVQNLSEPAAVSTRSGRSEEKPEHVAVDHTAAGDPNTIEGDQEEGAPAGLQDQTNLLPMRQLIVLFAGLSSAMFCSMLNQTIVSTALPTMGAVFRDASISSWIGTAYMLTSTACQPLYGRLSDIFGRKLLLVASLVIFLLGSIISGVSQNMSMLIVARAIAGIGGGGLITVPQIVVSDVVSLQERGKYQGIVGVVVAIATAVGPLIGGIFTEKVSWRWCFYISIPLTVTSIVIIVFGLPLKHVKGDTKKKLKQIDGIGCLISFVASILIIIPISWGGTQYSWTSPAVLVPLLIGVALIVLFIYVELKVATLPLIPMHIFKNTHVSTCILTSFLTGYATFVNLFYLPQFYQVVRGDSVLQSGILILPLILSQIITSFSSGFLVSKYSCYRINLVVGYALWAIASGLFTTVTPSTSSGKLVAYQILTGLGSGQTLQTTLVAIQAAVKRHEMAVTTSARNFLRMMGSTIAVAACGTIINNIVRTQLEAQSFDSRIISEILSDPTEINTLGLSSSQVTEAVAAYARGVQVVYYMMTALAGIQCLLCIFFVKDYSLKRDDDEKQKAAAKSWLEQRKKRGTGTDLEASNAK